MNAARQPADDQGTVATHRSARRDYHILERLEAGIELRGSEVKSVRAGDVSLNESFAQLEQGQLFLMGLHIKPYACSHHVPSDPVRPRRLLVHRHEIKRLVGQLTLKGLTLVPLRLYLRRGRIKVELALARGRQQGDKREALRRKTADREAARAIAARRPG